MTVELISKRTFSILDHIKTGENFNTVFNKGNPWIGTQTSLIYNTVKLSPALAEFLIFINVQFNIFRGNVIHKLVGPDKSEYYVMVNIVQYYNVSGFEKNIAKTIERVSSQINSLLNKEVVLDKDDFMMNNDYLLIFIPTCKTLESIAQALPDIKSNHVKNLPVTPVDKLFPRRPLVKRIHDTYMDNIIREVEQKFPLLANSQWNGSNSVESAYVQTNMGILWVGGVSDKHNRHVIEFAKKYSDIRFSGFLDLEDMRLPCIMTNKVNLFRMNCFVDALHKAKLGGSFSITYRDEDVAERCKVKYDFSLVGLIYELGDINKVRERILSTIDKAINQIFSFDQGGVNTLILYKAMIAPHLTDILKVAEQIYKDGGDYTIRLSLSDFGLNRNGDIVVVPNEFSYDIHGALLPLYDNNVNEKLQSLLHSLGREA